MARGAGTPFFVAIMACALCMLQQSSWRASAATHNVLSHVDKNVLDGVNSEIPIQAKDEPKVPFANEVAAPPPAPLPAAKEHQGKSMLKNKTMMNKHLQSSNLTGMSVIKGFCMDGLHCWPVQVFSITMMGVHVICTAVAIYVSANLYSSGITSAKFYQGGGGVLLGMSLLGLGIGAGASRFMEYGILKTLALAGPMMSIFASIVLIGRRGILLGAIGGVCAGLPIGAMMESHEVGISLGAIIGLLVGCILGVCPFFGTLDLNQRYMNKQNQFGSFSEPGSFSSDGYAGYQTVIKMTSTDFR